MAKSKLFLMTLGSLTFYMFETFHKYKDLKFI